jgi:cytochrome c biogenesis protein CcmG/thiol:disulfide interchange protein DsbE
MLASENKKFKILGINFKDKKNNALSFLSELGDPYNFVAKDPDGKTSILFGTYGIPESILIDKDLIIRKKIIGPIDFKQYKEILNLIQ